MVKLLRLMLVYWLNGSQVEASTEYVYTVNDGPILKNKNLTVDAYCSELFKPETVVNTYDVPVDPLLDETEWNVPKSISDEVVMPPIYKRPPGRPKKKRDKPLQELMIGKRRNSCGKCGRLGHNRRSCDNPPLNKKNK
ncbi:uncharacterized protein LOC132628829 [Lycium barbarum]|uniref:uncharacterized protein LOC132628829 n=1 Tax=Lycium barbarum TaxID=112863 RepID=UPI00293E6CD6|nr:uncharacterized protein LOC132628829 [Lycium barbarum]